MFHGVLNHEPEWQHLGDFAAPLFDLYRQAYLPGGATSVKNAWPAMLTAEPNLKVLQGSRDDLYPRIVPATPELLAKLDRLPYTDSGQAEAIEILFADHLRYVPDVGWRVFDGQHWTNDNREIVIQYALTSARLRRQAVSQRALTFVDKETAKAWETDTKWAKRAEDKVRLNAGTYSFLASILPYNNAEWEKLSIFLNFLIPKLPAPVEEDLSRGILEAIDMDSYRVEVQSSIAISPPDQDAEIGPVPADGSGYKPEPELDRLSNILKAFNDLFGNISWTDRDRVRRLITQEIPAQVAADTAYQNARQYSDRQNARIEHDKALARVMTAFLKDDTQLFKQFSDNQDFRRWLTETVFALTYEMGA